jgi:hypothetical protein
MLLGTKEAPTNRIEPKRLLGSTPSFCYCARFILPLVPEVIAEGISNSANANVIEVAHAEGTNEV